jgi:mercuric ion transport protein
MKERSTRRDGFSLLGVGAVACVACCAGPILAVLGGVSLAGLASTVFIGAAGLVIAVAALAAYFVVRQRQHRNRDTVIEPVPAELGRKPE